MTTKFLGVTTGLGDPCSLCAAITWPRSVYTTRVNSGPARHAHYVCFGGHAEHLWSVMWSAPATDALPSRIEQDAVSAAICPGHVLPDGELHPGCSPRPHRHHHVEDEWRSYYPQQPLNN